MFQCDSVASDYHSYAQTWALGVSTVVGYASIFPTAVTFSKNSFLSVVLQ